MSYAETLITVYDLLFGLMLTSSQEVYERLVVNVGWLAEAGLSSAERGVISIPNPGATGPHRACLLSRLWASISQLKMHNTSLASCDRMVSCPIDLCILFNACWAIPWFGEMFAARSHTSAVRYKLGYHFSEERKIKWGNVAAFPKGFQGCVEGWRENNGTSTRSLVALHTQTKILVVLMQSKDPARDLDRVVRWCLRNMKTCGTRSYLQECR